VLENERPLLVSVARKANRILRGRGPHLFGSDCAVRIMAIATLHQPFVYAMVEGHFELGLLLRVTRITQLRLRFRQQELFGGRMVRRMAGDATDVVLGVDRVDGVHVLSATSMATHAAGVYFLGRSVLEYEDLGFVAAARYVVGAGPVAALTSLVRWTTFRIEGGLPMWCLLPTVVDLLVTGFAGFRSHVLGDFGRRRSGHGCACGMSALIGSGLGSLA